MKRAVFFDKDGTLVENVPCNADPRRIRLTDGALEATRRLSREGYLVVVITNQPGVAEGRISEAELEAVALHLRAIGVPCDGFYACPHAPAAADGPACVCRKPQPGLLLRAAQELDIDLGASWMIGDILDDVEAGNRAGCRSILFLNGGETLWARSDFRRPEQMVFTLGRAVQHVLAAPAASRS